MSQTTVLILVGIILFFVKKPLFSLCMGVLCILIMGLLVATSRRDRVRKAYAQLLLHRIRLHKPLTLKQWRAFNRLVDDGIIAQTEAVKYTFVSVPELHSVNRGTWITPPKLA